MSTKEVLPLTTFALGLYALLSERQRVVGTVTMAVSTLWFVLAVFVFIPYFSPEGQSQYFAEYYGWLGGTPGTAIAQMVSHPEAVWQRLIEADSLQYVERLLRPWVYTPLRGLPILLVAAPALLLNVLSDFCFQLRPLNFFQCAAAIAPFVVVAAIDGTALLSRSVGSFLDQRFASSGRRLDTRLAVAGIVVALSLVVSLTIQRYHGFLPFSQDFYLAPRSEKVQAAESLVRQVPAEGTVSADLISGPHLSQRADIYLYPSVRDADFVVFALTDPSGEIVPGTAREFDASVWYPPSRWTEGEVIRTATLPWSLEDPARFGVALGVVEGPGFWELDKRLEPTIGSSPWPMPQIHDGSLVWLRPWPRTAGSSRWKGRTSRAEVGGSRPSSRYRIARSVRCRIPPPGAVGHRHYGCD